MLRSGLQRSHEPSIHNWIVCGLRWASESFAISLVIMFCFTEKSFKGLCVCVCGFIFSGSLFCYQRNIFPFFSYLFLIFLTWFPSVLLLFAWPLKPSFLVFLPLLNFTIDEQEGKACQLGWNQDDGSDFIRGLVTASVQGCLRNTSPHSIQTKCKLVLRLKSFINMELEKNHLIIVNNNFKKILRF